MQSTAFLLLSAALLSVAAADDGEAFLTKFVSDVKANPKQYLNFLQTAKNVPPDVTLLALKVRTYTDDSYTTLVDSQQVALIESFATGLPWYSLRLAGADAGSGSGSDSTSSADSSDQGSKTTAAPAGGKTTNAASSRLSKAKAQTESSADYGFNTHTGGANMAYVPLGAGVGVLGVVAALL